MNSRGRSCRRLGLQTRHENRVRGSTAEQDEVIRSFVGAQCLRSLVADFGIIHETIRGAERYVQIAIK